MGPREAAAHVHLQTLYALLAYQAESQLSPPWSSLFPNLSFQESQRQAFNALTVISAEGVSRCARWQGRHLEKVGSLSWVTLSWCLCDTAQMVGVSSVSSRVRAPVQTPIWAGQAAPGTLMHGPGQYGLNRELWKEAEFEFCS